MSFFQIIKNFILTKRYFYFLPRKLRLKIFNLKKLKLYKTSTGKYYLPQYAYKDLIRNEIINNMIFDKKVFDVGKSIIKENSIVIDVAITHHEGKLLGDTDFSKIIETTSYATPVPGGVGPMTVAMLLKNTVTAATLSKGIVS